MQEFAIERFTRNRFFWRSCIHFETELQVDFKADSEADQ